MRKSIIKYLVKCYFDIALFDTEPLTYMLENGFKGFNNCTTSELMMRYYAERHFKSIKDQRQKYKKFKKQIRTAIRAKKTSMVYPLIHFSRHDS
jgi:hypothetical protein